MLRDGRGRITGLFQSVQTIWLLENSGQKSGAYPGGVRAVFVEKHFRQILNETDLFAATLLHAKRRLSGCKGRKLRDFRPDDGNCRDCKSNLAGFLGAILPKRCFLIICRAYPPGCAPFE
jgi:hypothetical protein